MKRKLSHNRAFSLIELLVAMSIIALLSSVVFATLSKARTKARDMARISNARQLAIALEQYEQSNNSYKMSNCGYNNDGGGFASKGSETVGYTNSIAEQLKNGGYYNSPKLLDPVFGTDNYYIGLCTSTNAYNVFIKLEQEEYNTASSSIANTCGGTDALSNGLSFIGSTTGGSAGVITPGINTNTFAAAYERGMGPDSLPSGGGGGEIIPPVASMGMIDLSFDPKVGPDYLIRTSKIDQNGKILIAGDIETYRGVARKGIARLNSDGSLDTTFDSSVGANNVIFSTAIQPDGKIIIGGHFTSYGGTLINRIARINIDGSLDTTFNPGSGVNNIVYAISIQPDGKIIIGGGFMFYNGVTKNILLRVNSEGVLDTGFISGSTSFDNIVRSITIQPDDKIIVAGDFTKYKTTSRNRIARLNLDGSIDTSFDSSVGANGRIYNVALQPDGKIIIAGVFTAYNGISRNHIARINSDGSLDTTFNPGVGTNANITTLALQPDGRIIIGGDFTSYDDTLRNYIARINTNGSLDTSFDPGSGANANITTLSLQPDGNIIICGYFSSYYDTLINNIARIK